MRFRTVLMTALLGCCLWRCRAVGSEVQRPLAVVIIGGLVSATFLTLVALPALYSLIERRGRRAEPVVTSKEPVAVG